MPLPQGLKIWESWEVLSETIGRDTMPVSRALNLSPSLIGKWKEPPATEDDYTQSGLRNCLDRIEIIISTIENKDPQRAYLPIHWLCARFSFVAVPLPEPKVKPEDLQKSILNWTKEFGQTCEGVSVAISDGRVSRAEVKTVYREMLEDMQAGMGLLYLLQELAE